MNDFKKRIIEMAKIKLNFDKPEEIYNIYDLNVVEDEVTGDIFICTKTKKLLNSTRMCKNNRKKYRRWNRKSRI